MAGLDSLSSVFSEAVDNSQGAGVNYIGDAHANGFTINTDGTDFLGIEGSTYNNPGILGFDNNVMNTISDEHGVGFIPGLQAGDDTLFVGSAGATYSNPGPNNGTFYVDDYQNGPSPSFFNFTKNMNPFDDSEYQGINGELFSHPDIDSQMQIESNQWLDSFNHKFTPNRQHLDTSEFLGTNGETYKNPGLNNGIFYYDAYNDAGLGVDAIDNIHASGFKKLKQHKDTSDFVMVGDAELIDVSADKSLLRQFGKGPFTFGNNLENKYLAFPGNTYIESSKIDPDDVSLIQRGGLRSVGSTSVLAGNEVTNTTLKDLYNTHINNLIDFEQVKGKTDGRLDMRYDNGRFSFNSFLPLAFSRNGVVHEPYIISPIGTARGPVAQSLDEAERLGKYILSPDGIKFIAAQNAMGLLAYQFNRSVEHGTSETYNQLSVGKAQFQYLYNPLSMFSSVIPFVKIRTTRAFILDNQKYTERDVVKLFGKSLDFLSPNENADVKGIIKQSVDEEEHNTTLGGSIVKNVNTSIDGSPIGSQGITGDYHTLAPIDTEDVVKNEKRGNKDTLASIEEGYPFYFKDMRNDKILMFRGYIKDMTETITPEYNSETYIGRSEPVVSYTSTTREVNFSLDLYANTKEEFTAIYKKLDYLSSLCYPEYFNDSSTEGYTLTRPKPPLCRMRLAELYGGGAPAQINNSKLKHGILGFITSVSYTFNEEGTWNNEDLNSRAPKYITATIDYRVIHDRTPDINTRFYGVNYTKELGV